jgi:hypothetical protein
MGIREINKEIKELEKLLTEKKEELQRALPESFWTCKSCNKRTKLKDLLFAQRCDFSHGYGGDLSITTQSIQIDCPNCNKTLEYDRWDNRQEFNNISKKMAYFRKRVFREKSGNEVFDLDSCGGFSPEKLYF